MQKDSNLHFYETISSDINLLSIVVPTFNEEEVLMAFNKRLSSVLDKMPMNTEIVYVNDGSTDKSLDIMKKIKEKDLNVSIVDLSRNFGKEVALTAGLDHSNGDAVVFIDADLQDPPELIPELVKHWMNGYDVVNAKRIKREGESFLKKTTAHIFYRILKKSGSVYIPEDTGDFRLLSKRAVNSLKQLKEKHRFMKGLFAWIGYPQKTITYHRGPRYAGKTKWNYLGLWNLAIEGITSFTIAPLKMATYFGLITALWAFVYAIFIICKTLIYGDPVRGYPTLIVVILLLGGVQLVTIGVVGEYLGRVFNETKQRPLYFLKGYDPSKYEKRP
jgi:glycosyltransferase involved in cell wall biosynthesis